MPPTFKEPPDRQLIRRALRKSLYLGSLDEDQVQALVNEATLVRFRPGQALVLEGCVDGNPASSGQDVVRSESVEAEEETAAAAVEEHNEATTTRQPLEDSSIDPPQSTATSGEEALVEPENDPNDSPVESSDQPDAAFPAAAASEEESSSVDAKPANNQQQLSTPPDHALHEFLPSLPSVLSTTTTTLSLDVTPPSTDTDIAPPAPPRSQAPRTLYIIRHGHAEVSYQSHPTAILTPGTLVGEGGFLWERPHSASVVASTPLECWAINWETFCHTILPQSTTLQQKFAAEATHHDATGVAYMDQYPGPLPTTTNQRIYLHDYCLLQLLWSRPDPHVDWAFGWMDRRSKGHLQSDDLSEFLDIDSDFCHRFLGPHNKLRPQHFSQFLLELPKELGSQAFGKVANAQGCVTPTELQTILHQSCQNVVPLAVMQRLPSGSALQYSYADFVAFQHVLLHLPGICHLLEQAEKIKEGPVSPDDLKVVSQVTGFSLSRRQIDIVIQLFDLDGDGFVSMEDATKVCGEDFFDRLVVVKGPDNTLTFAPAASDDDEKNEEPVAPLVWLAQQSTLLLASTTLGAFLLYPLDMVKTRMMNQRPTADGKYRYASAVSCLQQTLHVEKLGVYRGLAPQLLGIVPERLIKLQVNDLLRQAWHLLDQDSSEKPTFHLPFEILSGALTGACQLLVTNPTEITKIRMQMQGETAQLLRLKGITPAVAPQSMSAVFRDLGFPGVYRGASACLLRDVPFSAMLFPLYSATKEYLVSQRDPPRRTTSMDLWIAGTVSAIPAAFLTTPADVIKTRLQVAPRPGEAIYTGIQDCATQIYEKEGLSALFRGSLVRTLRIAPQFGLSVWAYEHLSGWMGIRSACHPPTDVFVDPKDYREAFPWKG